LVSELKRIIKKDEGDSVICYKFRTEKYTERLVYGNDKKDEIIEKVFKKYKK